MTLTEAVERYQAIPADSKANFLVLLSYDLTVYMRGCYDEQNADVRAKKLEGANEIQHQVTQQLSHHLDKDLNRYPDEIFLRICAEKSALFGIEYAFGGALSYRLNKLNDQ